MTKIFSKPVLIVTGLVGAIVALATSEAKAKKGLSYEVTADEMARDQPLLSALVPTWTTVRALAIEQGIRVQKAVNVQDRGLYTVIAYPDGNAQVWFGTPDWM